MGEEIKIKSVEAENGGTLIQVDTDKGRLFIKTRDIFRALNNYIYLKFDDEMLKNGAELEDPEHYINPNLII